MKTIKITNYISTGLLSAMLVMSAGMYFFKYDDISLVFANLGYPTYIIYPLAIAKILGVIALWIPKMPALKEWTYSAIFFELLLALSAHLNIGDGEFGGAAGALVLLVVSYFTHKKLTA